MKNVISESAVNMTMQVKAQAGQTTIAQGYCQAILQQPNLNFWHNEKLKDIQQKINDCLATAKDNANYYLGSIQPQIITNVANIENFFTLTGSVPTILPASAGKKEWLNILEVLDDEARVYSKASKKTVEKLAKLHEHLVASSTEFNTLNNELNILLGGDEKALKELQTKLAEVDSKISEIINDAVISDMVVAGNFFLAVIGAVGKSFKPELPRYLFVINGIITVVAVGKGIISGIALANLYDYKATLLHQIKPRSPEVRILTGVVDTYHSLVNHIKNVSSATEAMCNAWDFIRKSIKGLINDLEKDQIDKEKVRQLFVSATDGAIRILMSDIKTINTKMTGVETKCAPEGTDISDFIRAITKGEVSSSFFN